MIDQARKPDLSLNGLESISNNEEGDNQGDELEDSDNNSEDDQEDEQLPVQPVIQRGQIQRKRPCSTMNEGLDGEDNGPPLPGMPTEGSSSTQS